ncbi:hypothetical protein [Microseira wollei]|nr:hypothetical protein [Microseira wollei]
MSLARRFILLGTARAATYENWAIASGAIAQNCHEFLSKLLILS